MNFLFARKKSGESGASDVRDEFEKLCRRLILLLSKCSASVFSLRESRREKRLLKNIKPEDENLIFSLFEPPQSRLFLYFTDIFLRIRGAQKFWKNASKEKEKLLVFER
jgi:hypothetical protein